LIERYYRDFINFIEKERPSWQTQGLALEIALKNGELSKEEYHCRLQEIQPITILKEKLLTAEYSNKELVESRKAAIGRVLDYGGGIGDLSLYLAQGGYKVTYFEVNEACIEFAMHLFNLYQVTETIDYEIIPSYDTIFALNIIDHLDDPVGTIKKYYNWLNAGGRLVISASYDKNANPVHVSDEKVIDEIEDFLASAFQEVSLEEQNDHHRIFLKRESILKKPQNSLGFWLRPPDGEYCLDEIEVILSEDVEMIQTAHTLLVGFRQAYRQRIIVEKELWELLLRMGKLTNLERLYQWTINYYKVVDFRDEFYRIIQKLWDMRIITGRIVKGGVKND
jgi:SAM-dependent methyltransferase